ncbi:MAG: protoheme IX farnesyltransferase [Ignavibacteria bacterium]
MRSHMQTDGTIVVQQSRFADYITLTKPELTLLSVLTALGGYFLGADGNMSLSTIVHTLVGTMLVGGGAGALNQYIERDYDALMRRTEHRPLPAGRLVPSEVLLFGTLLSLVGVVELFAFVNLLTGLLALATLVSYLFLYTPLKRVTPFSTVIGGVPGALPPMIGWAAARNAIGIEAWILFGILFCWQMPHFFSLAWMYRRDYERAGYPMLTVLDQDGNRTSLHILLYCNGLIPISLMLSTSAGLGLVYAIGAVIVGGTYLYYGILLRKSKSNADARKLFFVSLLYLPALLVLMVLDKFGMP